MKKNFLIPLIISIILGFIAAQIVYNEYDKKQVVNQNNTYILQGGVYTTKETLDKAIKSFNNYLVVSEEDKYYVYLAMTSSKDNVDKLKKMYEDTGIDIYVREVNVDNAEFVSNLEQYDVLIRSVDNNDNLISINEVILSSYEELVLGNE
jgi:hypothetical protein